MRHRVWLVLGLVALSFAAAAKEKDKQKNKPLFGVPPGMTAPNGKGFSADKEKYLILVLQDGEGDLSVQPVMARLRNDYLKLLADRHTEALRTWQGGADAWKQDPATKGKPYDVPRPKPTVVVRENGPLTLADAKKQYEEVTAELQKRAAEKRKREAEKEAREAAARKAADAAKAQEDKKKAPDRTDEKSDRKVEDE